MSNKRITLKVKLNNPIMVLNLTEDEYKEFKKRSPIGQEHQIIANGKIEYTSIDVSYRSKINIQHFDENKF